MGVSRLLPRTTVALAVLVLGVATLAGGATATDPYTPDTTCASFAYWNVVALGSFNQTASEVGGPLLVVGDARLDGFSVNPTGQCGRDGRTPNVVAAVVGGRLRANNGQWNAGKVVTRPGRYSASRSVGLRCARVTPRAINFEPLVTFTVNGHAGVCRSEAVYCNTRVDEGRGVTFHIRRGGEATCAVSARDLAAATRVAIVGRTRGQVVIIKVDGDGRYGPRGKALTLSDFQADGFLPAFTVMALCDVERLVVDNTGIPSALLAPQTDLSGAAGQVTGNAFFRSFRGGIEFRHEPWGACEPEGAVPSPEADA